MDEVKKLLDGVDDHFADACRYLIYGAFFSKEKNYFAAKRLIAEGGRWKVEKEVQLGGYASEEDLLGAYNECREFRSLHELMGLRVTFHQEERDWRGEYMTAEKFVPVTLPELAEARELVLKYEAEQQEKEKNRPTTIQWRRPIPFTPEPENN